MTARDPSSKDTLPVALFSEIAMVDQLVRARIAKVLPKGMALSHFMVLNHLAGTHAERTPAQLARLFHVTKGAMTNTISRLEMAGYVHVRPDWDDARRKFVALSPAGLQARDQALSTIAPLFDSLVARLGREDARKVLPVLRALRADLSQDWEPLHRV